MNNDADQKVKWREWWIRYDLQTVNEVESYVDSIHVIEAAQALAEIESLHKLHDMNQTIIDGMRGVVAMARAVNNQTPDARVTHQLKRFDADKLSDYRDAEIESLRAENAELKEWKKSMGGAMPLELVDRSRFLLKQAYETKLSAATAQMEKLVEALIIIRSFGYMTQFKIIDQALAQYQQFKKDSASE